MKICLLLLAGLLATPLIAAETTEDSSSQEPRDNRQIDRIENSERWNLFFQATSIGQSHGPFRSPYSGPFSLQNRTEREASLTTTFFLGFRVARNTQIYIDPEIAGGRGFSGVNGIANAPNGELPRVASATPKPYLARAHITQDFGFGDEIERFSSDENQLAGSRPLKRYSIQWRSEEHTSELQSHHDLVCRLLLEKKKN